MLAIAPAKELKCNSKHLHRFAGKRFSNNFMYLPSSQILTKKKIAKKEQRIIYLISRKREDRLEVFIHQGK